MVMDYDKRLFKLLMDCGAYDRISSHLTQFKDTLGTPSSYGLDFDLFSWTVSSSKLDSPTTATLLLPPPPLLLLLLSASICTPSDPFKFSELFSTPRQILNRIAGPISADPVDRSRIQTRKGSVYMAVDEGAVERGVAL